ncbi:MAG: nucleoside transporter C-terminal domain-containing protein [Pseudomonadota bacterium]
MTSLVGIILIVGVCFVFSSNRRAIVWPQVFWGIFLQFIFGILILKTYPERVFAIAQYVFEGLNYCASTGSRFLFGALAGNVDFTILSMGAVIIFVSSIMGMLNYLRVLPATMYVLARLMQKTMRTSGAETMAAAMFVMMGVEVTTALKNVLGKLTKSELFTVMTCFMATIAGSVMAVYVGVFGAKAGHILAASIMNAPAGLVISKMLLPETSTPETQGAWSWRNITSEDHSLVESAANGAIDGLKLTATISAVLLAFVSCINLINGGLGTFGTSFENLGGYLFAPVAFLIGTPWADCAKAGELLALKTFFNEWIAYSHLKIMVSEGSISPRGTMIMTYALCSFANFGSLAILIGGLSALAPERRSEIAGLGLKALLAGLLAGFMTAAMAGLLLQS